MKRSTQPAPLQEAVSNALQAVSVARAAVLDAQNQVAASYKSALHEKETRVAAAIFPVVERLQAARGVTTFCRMRLGEIAKNIDAREGRRTTWRTRRKGE